MTRVSPNWTRSAGTARRRVRGAPPLAHRRLPRPSAPDSARARVPVRPQHSVVGRDRLRRRGPITVTVCAARALRRPNSGGVVRCVVAAAGDELRVRPLLDHPHAAHQHAAVAPRRDVRLVRGDDDRRRALPAAVPAAGAKAGHAPIAGDRGYGVEQRRADRGVYGAEGIVEDEEAGAAVQGAGERHTLLLPPAQRDAALADLRLPPLGEEREIARELRGRDRCGEAPLVPPPPHDHVVPHRAGDDERPLGDVPDAAVDARGAGPGLELQLADQRADDGGLPRTHTAEDADQLPPPHPQIDPLEAAGPPPRDGRDGRGGGAAGPREGRALDVDGEIASLGGGVEGAVLGEAQAVRPPHYHRTNSAATALHRTSPHSTALPPHFTALPPHFTALHRSHSSLLVTHDAPFAASSQYPA
eukprot:gene34283-biopygen2261